MGGLISRYAIGELYDAETGTLAGLKPSHYVSLATPHCGCVAGPGEAQVPLFAWMDAVPAVGGMLSRTVTALSRPYVSIVLGRTGKQFFLLDRDGGGPPFMYRLACDWPGEGLLFLTALSRFETRTVYANRSGDHLVGWANSSLRRLSELPDDDRKSGRGKGGRGVVREDPLEWAWAPAARAALRNTEAGQRLDPGHGHTVSVGAVMEAETAEELVESTAAESQTTWKSTTSAGTGNLEGGNSDVTIQARAVLPPSLDPASASAAEFVDAALTALQGLPWRRVDCCFAGGALPLLAHQHLQVQRKYVNWEGMATARHLAMQVAAMEELVLEEAGVPVPVKNGVNASV